MYLPEFVNYREIENRQKYIQVSKLLTCVQVILEFAEYRFDKRSGKLKVLGMNNLYEYDLFDNLSNGSARICAEDFNIGTNNVTVSAEQKQ